VEARRTAVARRVIKAGIAVAVRGVADLQADKNMPLIRSMKSGIL